VTHILFFPTIVISHQPSTLARVAFGGPCPRSRPREWFLFSPVLIKSKKERKNETMMIKQQHTFSHQAKALLSLEPIILVNAECLLQPKICSFRHESKTGSPNGNSLFDSDSTLDTTFTCTTTTTDSTHQQMVRFSVVQRREYSVTLGDHSLPDCFPLSLDWSHTQEQEASLDDYERSREKSRRVPLLTPFERCERISNVTGLSMDELEAQEYKRLMDLEMEELLV
jgi:hypothetical protein